jgi:GT2 family glycosyltransferase
MIDELDRHPEVAVVGPRLVDAAGRAELSFGRMVGPLNELRQKILMRGHETGRGVIFPSVDRATRREQFPDWVSGACLLVRRRDADAVGLLDERYFMYLEDVDFCAAIRARGRRVLFAPAVEVIHLRGQSARSAAGTLASTGRAYRRSQVAFYTKHHPRWVPLLRLYLRLRGADT